MFNEQFPNPEDPYVGEQGGKRGGRGKRGGQGGRCERGGFGGRGQTGADFGPGSGPSGPGFGPGRGFGPARAGFGPSGSRGRRRRGGLRFALLALLSETGPQTGSELIQKLAERSLGRRTPSPTAVYPALQMLEDDGLVTGGTAESGSGRSYELSDEGKTLVEKLRSEPNQAWPGANEDLLKLRRAAIATIAAARQVGFAGTSEDAARAAALLDEARRGIYRLLAESDTVAEGDTLGNEPAATDD